MHTVLDPKVYGLHINILVSLSHVSTTEAASDSLQVYLYWNNALELVVIRNGEQKTYKLETDSVVDFFEKLEDLKPIFQGSWNKKEKRGVYSMGFEFDGSRYVIQGTVHFFFQFTVGVDRKWNRMFEP